MFLKSKNSAVSSLLDQSGRIIEDDHEKAELLNSYFVRQSSQSASAGDPPVVNTEPVTDPSQILTQFEVSLDDVRQALRTLDPRKALGCDGVPTRLILWWLRKLRHVFITFHIKLANSEPASRLEVGNRQPSTKSVGADNRPPTIDRFHF